MEEVVQEKQLQACLDGYARFLTRKKLKGNNNGDGGDDGDEDDGEATYDVDVVWYDTDNQHCRLLWGDEKTALNSNARVHHRHAHMLHPQAYWRDCAQTGLALDHRPWPHLFPPKST
jgi:hypothetical protein